MATLKHSSIGHIQGKQGDGVIQYLGIPYATLKDRFAKAQLAQYPLEGTVDATKLGPSVLSPPNAVDFEQALIQKTLPYEGLSVSDLEGLIVNITVPEGVQAHSKLPVFVFIYGGGFNIGSSSWPEYDFARIIKLSADIGSPVIGVSFNYRLGLPGFLTSSDLRAAGYKPNNGLRDQRTALLWVQKHIAGFGGDPANVTCAGESAGGASVAYHLQSEQPLFRRAVPMSGTPLLVKPMPLQAAEGGYAGALKALGLESKTREEQIEALLSIPGEQLLEKTGRSVHVGPVEDGEILRGTPSFDVISRPVETSEFPLPGRLWCESLMIGDCAFDGNIMSLQFGPRKAGIGAAFRKHFETVLPEHAAELFEAYGIGPETSDDEAFVAVLRFTNDIGFYAPTIAYASGFAESSSVYQYRFNELNEWEGPWKGESTHILDVAFLFQNYNEHLSIEQRTVAMEFAKLFITFVNGKAPWQPWKLHDSVAMVMEGGKLAVRKDVPAETGRRAIFIDLAKKAGFDSLSATWSQFLHG